MATVVVVVVVGCGGCGADGIYDENVFVDKRHHMHLIGVAEHQGV